MAEGFDSFKAPQFFDFSKDLNQDENADLYFEEDHECESCDPSQDPLKLRNSEKYQNEGYSEFYSSFETTPGPSYCWENNECKPRRSMSVGDLVCNSEHEEAKDSNQTTRNVNTSAAKEENIKYKCSGLHNSDSSSSLNKNKAGPMRRNTPRLTKAASKESLERLAKPKKYSSAQNLYKDNYVPMAEFIKKFQFGTPSRFRTTPSKAVAGKIRATIPQSPALMTKNRHRPVQALSREEQEKLEFEEAQKFKIKARPLNMKILQGPIKPLIPMEKRPTTTVEPFNITAPKKKVAELPKEEFVVFHAAPAPYADHAAPKQVRKKLTVPQTPSFMKRYPKEPPKPQPKEEEPKKHFKLEPTVPVPFSFERREQAIQKRKEVLINKALEEEKKAKEFHARPIPKGLLSPNKNISNLQRTNSKGSITKSDENLSSQFKARPASVLHQKPFEPKKERHLIEICEFELNTEKRAKEREEFEQLKKEKEERLALLKQREEQEQLQREAEEVNRLRKEMQYKAQPIKKYKEMNIQPSGKITVPKSPKLHKTRGADKENRDVSN